MPCTTQAPTQATLIGLPTDVGASRLGAAMGPDALRVAQLAPALEKLGIQGTSHIIFVIGGSIGIGKAVLEKSDYALSFSKMTFPHQLMRVILLEQIYRGYRIMSGEPYHK